MMVVFVSLLFALLMHGCASEFNQSLDYENLKPPSSNQPNARLVFPIEGDLYHGLFYAVMYVGLPQGGHTYYLDLDTGSDLTWIQCDGPRAKRAPHRPYKPHNNFIPKTDPDCPSGGSNHTKKQLQTNNCDFRVRYQDGGSSSGLVVRDVFPLHDYVSKRTLTPSLVFGCGSYEQRGEERRELNFDGLLGLGKARSSLPSQLKALGVSQNYHAHCLSRQRKGFGFFGRGSRSPSPNADVWLPMQQSRHYAVGPAVLSLDGMLPRINVPSIILDTGSTYTYFSSPIYRTIYHLLQGSLSRAPIHLAPEDHFLSVCWKGHRPFNNINEVKPYFRPINLDFMQNKIIVLEPEDYLIISTSHNVCLGILDSAGEHMGDLNVLGDISMLEKLVQYDTDRGFIGWAPVKCRSISIEDDHAPILLGPGSDNAGNYSWSSI